MTDNILTRSLVIKLSKKELMYLTNTHFLSDDLGRLVASAKTIDQDARLLTVNREVAERFRDEFTTRLARSGFGSDYEPTREGELLEELIDKFSK